MQRIDTRISKVCSLLGIFVASLMISCAEEPEVSAKDFPYVMLRSVEVFNGSGVMLKAELVHLGKEPVTEKGFVWSLSSSPTVLDSYWKLPDTENSTGSFSLDINGGLINKSKYYVRAYVRTSSQIVYSNIIDFVSKGSKQPVIHEVDPIVSTSGTQFTIRGENFGYGGTASQVRVLVAGGEVAKGIIVTDTEIKFRVITAFAVKGFVTVQTAGMLATSPQQIEIAAAWTKKRSAKFVDEEAAYFSGPDKAYFIARNTNNLTAYDPVTNTYGAVTTLPENSGGRPLATSLGNMAYVILNTKIYAYTISTKTWQYLADYPYVRADNEYVFFIGNALYAGSYTTGKLYRYSISGNAWEEKQGHLQGGTPTNIVRNGVIVLNKAYFLLGASILEYNPATNGWSNIVPYYVLGNNATLFAADDKLYWGLGTASSTAWGNVNRNVFSYNPVNRKEEMQIQMTYGLRTFRTVTINNIAYVFAFGGPDNSVIDELWQFSPSPAPTL